MMVAEKVKKTEVDNRWPLISSDASVQRLYEEIRANGESHLFAEMCATRTPPGTGGTDKAFMQGHCNGKQFLGEERFGKKVTRIAERLKPGCTTGSVYMGSLANFPGDPEAWVGSRDDIRKVADKRNYEVHGLVERVPDSRGDAEMVAMTEKKYRIADDILDKMADAKIAEDPSLAPKRATLREELNEKHSPKFN